MKRRRHIFLSIILAFFACAYNYAATITSANNGSWDVGGTWVGGVAPGAGDNAIIATGTTVTLTGNESITDLTIQTGAIVDALTNNKELTIDGNLDVDGTLRADNKDIFFTGGAGVTLDGIGVVSISNGGKDFKIEGNITILSTANISWFCKTELDNGVVVTNNGTVTADDDIKGGNASSQWINAANSTLKVKDQLMNTGILTASATGNSVTYYGKNQSVKTPAASTYYDLIISGEPTQTQQANLIISNDLTLNGGEFDCGGHNIDIGGDWINNGVTFTEQTGTVNFNSGGAQNITTVNGETFYNFDISNGGTVTINTSDIIVSNTLTMTNGNISTGSNKITLGTAPGSAGTLTHTSGTIIGYFERWIPTTTPVTYLFPVGTASNYNPASVTFNTISAAGSVIANFVSASPGNNGLSLVDGVTIYNTFVDGYWELTTANSFAASNFDLALTGNGFTAFGIDANTRVLTRTDAASAWTANGTHAAASGNTANRTGVTTISGHYCFGDDTNCSSPATPTITSTDTDICTSTSGTYTVTNTGNTFSWSISPVSAGSFNPAPGAGDFQVTVDWGATGQVAYVICTESNGCTNSAPDSLEINLNAIPPTSMSGRTSVAKGTTGEPYSITARAGYTYTWTITGGTVAGGQGTSSITVDWNNTPTSGQVSVVAKNGSCADASPFNLAVNVYEVINSNGTGGGDWNTAATWDCVCIPQTTDNVRILSNDVVTQGNYNIDINHMIININGTLSRTTDNKDITITGDLTNDGLMTLGAGNKDLKLEGVGTYIDGTGTINFTAGGEVQVKNGNKIVNTTAILTISGGVFDLRDAGVVITNNGNITIGSDVTINDATNSWVNAANSTLNIGGDLFTAGAAILVSSASGNTVNYNGAGAQDIKTPSGNDYQNLSISTSNTKTMLAALDIDGDLLIQNAAILDPGGNNINLAGSWTNSSSDANPYVETTETVTLDGGSAQTITNTADETFYNLVVNNSSGGVSLATNTDVIVSNSLTLTSGVVTTGTNILNVTNNSYSSISRTSGYIYGNQTRSIGSNTDTYSFYVAKGSSASDFFQIDFINNNVTGTTALTASVAGITEGSPAGDIDANLTATQTSTPIIDIAETAQWTLSPNIALASGDFGVNLYTGNIGGLTDNQFCVLKRAESSVTYADWDSFDATTTIPGPGAAGRTVASGYTQRTGYTSFSLLAVGKSNVPLPVELIEFNATLNGEVVDLHWKTAMEINNDFFTVERSADGRNFTPIIKTLGHGNSEIEISYSEVDTSPLQGISYYRLKQTDFDGKYSYSKVVAINNVKTISNEQLPELTLFPNPTSSDNINLTLKNFSPKEEVLVVVYDTFGKQHYSKVILTGNNGETFLGVDTNYNLAAGTYIVIGSSNNQLYNKKLIIR